jgi:hypothetical protein
MMLAGLDMVLSVPDHGKSHSLELSLSRHALQDLHLLGKLEDLL